MTVTLGALAATACGGATAGPSAAPTTTNTPAPSAGAGASVPQVLQLSAPRVGGGTVSLASYAGRPVALWFWAPT
jgi:hypothetical protein